MLNSLRAVFFAGGMLLKHRGSMSAVRDEFDYDRHVRACEALGATAEDIELHEVAAWSLGCNSIFGATHVTSVGRELLQERLKQGDNAIPLSPRIWVHDLWDRCMLDIAAPRYGDGYTMQNYQLVLHDWVFQAAPLWEMLVPTERWQALRVVAAVVDEGAGDA